MAAPIASQLLQFAARYGNDILQTQAGLGAPLWKKLEHEKATGALGVVNPISPSLENGGFMADGGTRRQGTSNKPVRGTIEPRFIDVPLTLNNGALMVLTGRDDSAKYMESQLAAAGETAAQIIGSSCYAESGAILANPASPTAASTQMLVASAISGGVMTVHLRSIAGIKEGMSVTLFDKSALRAFVVRVASVVFGTTSGPFPMADANGVTVVLANDVAGIAGVGNNTDAAILTAFPVAASTTGIAEDGIYQRGVLSEEGVAANAVVDDSIRATSLADVTGTGLLHAISASDENIVGWKGNRFSGVGDPTQEAFLLRLGKVQSKSKTRPDLVVVSPMVSQILGFGGLTAAASAGGISNVGAGALKSVPKLDKYGREIFDDGVTLGLTEVMSDMNLQDDTAYLISKKHAKFLVWKDIEAQKQGGDTLLVSQTSFATVAFFQAAYNLMVDKRSAHARLDLDVDI